MSDRTELILNQDRISELWNETKKYVNENAQSVITGDPGQLIGIGDDGTAQATVYPCNENLLINPDLTNPVNRNGQTEYTSYGYTIDRWQLRGTNSYISLASSGLLFKTTNSIETWVQQLIESTEIAGKTVTVSLLYDDKLYEASGIVPYEGGAEANLGYKGAIRASISFRTGDKCPGICIWTNSTSGVTLKAAKLELGPVQTLAHKEGVEWVLNENPNYAEQYAICEQYSPITGEFVGSQHSNQNLLDNALFIGGGSQQGGGRFPVNQNAETEYTTVGYTIDRWSFRSPGDIKIDKNFITLTAGKSTWMVFGQTIEKELLNKKITATILYRTSSNFFRLVVASGNNTVEISKIIPASNDFSILSVTGIVGWGGNIYFKIDNSGNSNSGDLEIIAAKLELSSVQTLAHKEGGEWVLNDPTPNYELELEKCQRYQVELLLDDYSFWLVVGSGLASAENKASIFVPLPVSLRANPVSNVKYGGGWRLSPTGMWSDGMPVTSMVATYRSSNGIILTVGTDGGLSVKQMYQLVGENERKAHLLLDANL